jgi:hypothetical protein
MDCLRDLSDFIDDLPDRDPFDRAVLRLPELENKITDLLRKLRAQMDLFRNARRSRDREHDHQYHPPSERRKMESNLDMNWVATRQRGYKGTGGSSSSSGTGTSDPPSRQGSATLAPSVPRQIASREVDVRITTNMSLRCVEIADPTAIRADGVLYYIPHTRRFAIRIAGFLLQGNIGTVYISESHPEKIHDCEMYPACNPQTCLYYHNPSTCQGSTDIRNFASTSWCYYPGTSSRPSAKKMRKLSSRDNLDADILTITSADLSYFNEQLMHDILCGIIMNYYVRKTAS